MHLPTEGMSGDWRHLFGGFYLVNVIRFLLRFAVCFLGYVAKVLQSPVPRQTVIELYY